VKRRFLAWIVTLATVLLFARASHAAVEAHILRIDPRAGLNEGAPVLTSVIELVQFTPMSEVVTNAGCGQARGDALLDCISNAVSQKNALWKAFPFPEGGARLLVRVDGQENPAKFVSKTTWGAAGKDPLIGTAWLIALDASSQMGSRYGDAREVANQFIGTMGPNDIAKLIIFDDRISPYVAQTGWVASKDKAQIVNVLSANPSTSPSHQRSRPLFNQIKNITKSFGDLGNAGNVQNIPMHQAMVLLSNGAGREDAASAAISAEAMKQYFNKGRFPEDNPLSPKTPLPVISVYFPNARGFVNDTYAMNDMQFMQDIANPEIGGFFDIVRGGQGIAKATTILSNVKARFNAMYVVKWRLACLSSTAEQTFNLIFQNTNPPVKPDGSFRDIPIGVNPTEWPLDINVAQTKAETDANPVHPGGTMRVFGDFCWGGDKNRAEAYFVPAGTNPDQNVNKQDPDLAKKAMQHLIAQNMRGGATEAGDTFVTLTVPDEEKILEGQGDNTVTRVVIYDNKAKRASGVTAQTVLTLKAGKKPLNLPIILGAAGLVVVILLLVVVLMRGGGGKGKTGRNPPPAPVVAGGHGPHGGGGYGGAPGGPGGYGGGPPPGGYGGGGGYGASAPEPQPQAYVAPVPQPAPYVPPYVAPPPQPAPAPPPDPRGGGHPLASAGGAPGVVQVRCPACNSLTMATPGQFAVCFSCGQPLPRDAPPADAAPREQQYPLTGGMQSPLEPPPNPYGPQQGGPSPGGGATSAHIVGVSGTFAVRPGIEVKVGRDPAQCPITLSEPRVSGVHATLKFEGGRLMVRDEGSNNGTYVDGTRVASGTWTPVRAGGTVRFGPIEFTARLE
jgi:hypothetical protein